MGDVLSPLPRGPLVTLWHSNGLGAALRDARGFLAAAKPPAVQIHAGPQGTRDGFASTAKALREIIPGVTLACGIAWDGWIEDYHEGGASKRRSVEDLYMTAARAAHAAGAVLLVLNSEAAGKQYPHAARLLAVALIDRIREECPGMLLGHTAYDHPHYHPEERNNGGRIDADDEGYPWSVYLGGAVARAVPGLELPKTGRVDVSMEQVYAAPPKPEGKPQPMADLAALGRRIRSSAASFRKAEALGWIDPKVAHLSYQQAHHVPAASIVGENARTLRTAFWASPSRMDADGSRAVTFLAAAARGEVSRSNADPLVRAWAQGRLGIDGGSAWGTWGPKSRAAAEAYQRGAGLPVSGELDAATLSALVTDSRAQA